MPPPTDKELFLQALDRPLADRASFLDSACHGDDPLRARVDALLRAHDASDVVPVARDDGTAAQEGPAPRTSTYTPGPPAEGPGTRIGPYKLLQQIGEGGMGAVFMAEQERPVRRRVALKVIKAGMDTAQVIARFEAERQALAIMDHPGIARVLDAGATDSGRPYFVMELVQGVPITRYCDERRVPPRERLELMAGVCQAVQHAHQKGIIHRDIKPSNVLITEVDGKPVPKVIDFGVAKATSQSLTEKTLFTQFGAIVGTPEYMSPEQAGLGSVDVDTRSDIYSLGVLLYELLTGSTPLRRESLREAAFTEILRRIKEEEPATPSSRLSTTVEALPSIAASRGLEPARLTKLVRGELDLIVMKALEKDRTRRYDSAAGLARDLGRYLDGDPVEASPPSAAYRLRKLASKHRGALITATSFVGLLLFATAVSTGLAVWATRERSRALAAEELAKQQQERAEEGEQTAIQAVERFQRAITEEPELKNTPALQPLRKRLLTEPISFFRQLRDRFQAEKEMTPASLSRLAAAGATLGELNTEIGDLDDALRSYETARIVLERLLRDSPGDRVASQQLASVYINMGNLYHYTSRPDEALPAFGAARAILSPLTAQPGANADLIRKLAACDHNLGLVLFEAGRLDEAQAAWGRCLAMREGLAKEVPPSPEDQQILSYLQNNIGELYLATGRPAEAIVEFQKALEIRRRLASEFPGELSYRMDLATMLGSLGGLLGDSGRREDGLRHTAESCSVLERLLEENPSNTTVRHSSSLFLSNLGEFQRELGQHAAALASLEKARAILEALTRDIPSFTQLQYELVDCLNAIGNSHHDAGRHREALDCHERAIAISEPLVRRDPKAVDPGRRLADSLVQIAEILGEQGRRGEQAAANDRAISILERLAEETPDHPDLIRYLGLAYVMAGHARMVGGEPAESRDLFEKALALFERMSTQNPASDARIDQVSETLGYLAELDHAAGRFDDARSRLLRAIELAQRALSINPSSPVYQSRLLEHQSNLKKAEEGSTHATEAAPADEATSPP